MVAWGRNPRRWDDGVQPSIRPDPLALEDRRRRLHGRDRRHRLRSGNRAAYRLQDELFTLIFLYLYWTPDARLMRQDADTQARAITADTMRRIEQTVAAYR